jgi:uncharacterized protein (TIGR04255 family)
VLCLSRIEILAELYWDIALRIPKRITPNLIIEAVVEIKFEPKVPPDAILGLVYRGIEDKYKNLEKLPILQLPDEIRTRDSSFRYQPYYKMTSGDFVFQIGPKVLSLSVTKYPGWKSFAQEIKYIYNHCNDSGILDKIVRLGMRYIDFFESNIFEYCTLSLQFHGKNLSGQPTALHTKVVHDRYVSDLRISNMASLKRERGNKEGSIIDIDTYVDDPKFTADKQLIELLDSEHEIIKNLFFSLLNLNSLKL